MINDRFQCITRLPKITHTILIQDYIEIYNFHICRKIDRNQNLGPDSHSSFDAGRDPKLYVS